MEKLVDVEKDLIERIRKNDESVFKELVEMYKERAFNIAYGFTHNIEEAKDIVQESFIKVYENIKYFKGTSKFFTWFYRILINLCIDHQRKKNLFKIVSIFKNKNSTITGEVVSKSNNPKPEEVIEKTELRNKIEKSIEKLSLKEKEVFELKHYQGLKIKEIAEIMRVKEGTVKSLLFRAVNKLQKILGEVKYEKL